MADVAGSNNCDGFYIVEFHSLSLSPLGSEFYSKPLGATTALVSKGNTRFVW